MAILDTFACTIGLAVLEPSEIKETPLEILPEWYFFPTFNLLRVLPNKLVKVFSLILVPLGLLTGPFFENTNPYQSAFQCRGFRV